MSVYRTLKEHLFQEYGLTEKEAHHALGDFAIGAEESGGYQVVKEALHRLLGFEGDYFDVCAVTNDARREAREKIDADQRRRDAFDARCE